MQQLLDRIIRLIGLVRFRLSPSARCGLWERIGSLTEGGVPIGIAMDFLSQSQVHGAMSGFVQHQADAMKSARFSDAAQNWIPREELLVIELTQEGRIAEGFAQAAQIASVRAKLATTLAAGLAYPCTLLAIGGIVLSVLPQYALNIMGGVLDEQHWPAVSVSVLRFSEWLRNWGIFTCAGLMLLLVGSLTSASRWSGSVRAKLEWFPPFAIYRKFAGPEVLVAWLALMRAGVQRLRALDQLERGLPTYLAAHVRTMRSRLYSGAPIESALNTGLFSDETLEDLRIYDRIGKFSERSDRIAAEDVERALANLERMTKALSAFLLLLIAAVAIWIYVGIANVAFSIQQSVY